MTEHEHEVESSNRLREGRARGEAAHQGLRLEKSRSREPQAPEYGTYRLTDIATNRIVAWGPQGQYGLTLDDVERALGIVTAMTNPLNESDAKALWSRVADRLSDVAAVRHATGDAHMPARVRQYIRAMRRQLRAAGIPDEQIDTTPGLEPTDEADDE
jgi:hypothetical protein